MLATAGLASCDLQVDWSWGRWQLGQNDGLPSVPRLSVLAWEKHAL